MRMKRKDKRQNILKKNTEGLKKQYSKSGVLKKFFSILSTKNITIIRSFTVIMAISLLTTLVIGISSFVTINRTYSNLKVNVYKLSSKRNYI
jgi:hypothetical protein